MIAKNSACYYGRHVGCVNVNDPNCRRCAERLTNAVNQVVRPTCRRIKQRLVANFKQEGITNRRIKQRCSLHELQTRGDNDYDDDNKEQYYKGVYQSSFSQFTVRAIVVRICVFLAVHARGHLVGSDKKLCSEQLSVHHCGF